MKEIVAHTLEHVDAAQSPRKTDKSRARAEENVANSPTKF